MRLSNQGRLTVLYAATLLTAVVLCGVGLYAAVVHLERSSVNDNLERASSTIAFSMKAEEAEGLTLTAAATDTETELRMEGIALALYDGTGRLMAARWEGLAPPTRLQPDGFSTINDPRGEWRAHVTRPIFHDRGYVVMTAISLETVNRQIALVRAAFLAIVPLTFAFAVGGGWFLSRRTLKPVLESQRQFMADASHELRTPVSVIRSAADVTLSQQERPAAEYRDFMDVIAGQAKRLTRLVDDLFLLARADARGRPLMKSRFYLNDLLEECATTVNVLAQERGVDVHVTASDDIEVDADEELVRRMLINVIENAVHHSPVGTPVTVEMTRDHSTVAIYVRDRGAGIAPADRARIFDRFVRVEPRQYGGAGLGLPIARWIAEAHGGSLQLAESSPQGSVFVARLVTPPSS